MKRILITGGAGRIGTALRTGLANSQRILRLTDIANLGDVGPNEEVIETDLGDLNQVLSLCKGVDAIIHLAGLVSAKLSWEETLNNNIITNYNVFEAARANNVPRVIFASSIHAHGFCPRAQMISDQTPYRPDSLYGLAKVFGEATGHLYADKYGLEVICLRIASFRPEPQSERELATWLSPRDAVQLIERSLVAPDIHFLALYGTSNNDCGLYDTSNWEQIGYRPEDDSSVFTDTVVRGTEPKLEQIFHGAHFITPGFTGNADQII